MHEGGFRSSLGRLWTARETCITGGKPQEYETSYVAMTQTRRILMWLMLFVLTALVSYVGFRGYLTPEMLFNFANSFYC